ncbi:hypothetical protein, partial [Helicobacter sp. T3_23-1056]
MPRIASNACNHNNASSHNVGFSPSIVEVARGRVSCHTERSEVSQNVQINRDISGSRARNDKKTSVIASKKSVSEFLRGNPQCRISKIDCHDSATFDKVAESRNDGNANSFNDKIANFASAKSTHPHSTGCEALAEAKTPSAREGAYFGLPRATSCARNDGNAKSFNDDITKSHNDRIFTSLADLHTSCSPSLAEGVWGWVNKTTKPKKRLALSLATSAILASISIDTAVAWCQWKGNNVNSYHTLQCIGSDNGSSLSSSTWKTNWGNTFNSIYTVELGTENTALRINGDATLNLESNLRNIRLGRLNASNITLGGSISGKTLATIGTANVTSLTLQGNWDSVSLGNGSNFGAITISGTISNLTLNGGAIIGRLEKPTNATTSTINTLT